MQHDTASTILARLSCVCMHATCMLHMDDWIARMHACRRRWLACAWWAVQLGCMTSACGIMVFEGGGGGGVGLSCRPLCAGRHGQNGQRRHMWQPGALQTQCLVAPGLPDVVQAPPGRCWRHLGHARAGRDRQQGVMKKVKCFAGQQQCCCSRPGGQLTGCSSAESSAVLALAEEGLHVHSRTCQLWWAGSVPLCIWQQQAAAAV